MEQHAAQAIAMAEVEGAEEVAPAAEVGAAGAAGVAGAAHAAPNQETFLLAVAVASQPVIPKDIQRP